MTIRRVVKSISLDVSTLLSHMYSTVLGGVERYATASFFVGVDLRLTSPRVRPEACPVDWVVYM